MQNLVGNAAHHGSRVALTVRLAARQVAFIVEDDGPGIPEAAAPARCSPSPGSIPRARRPPAATSAWPVIALDVARSHGGSLELGQSPDLGGLRATLRLPREGTPGRPARGHWPGLVVRPAEDPG